MYSWPPKFVLAEVLLKKKKFGYLCYCFRTPPTWIHNPVTKKTRPWSSITHVRISCSLEGIGVATKRVRLRPFLRTRLATVAAIKRVGRTSTTGSLFSRKVETVVLYHTSSNSLLTRGHRDWESVCGCGRFCARGRLQLQPWSGSAAPPAPRARCCAPAAAAARPRTAGLCVAKLRRVHTSVVV